MCVVSAAMDILNIKEKFAKRVVDAENEIKSIPVKNIVGKKFGAEPPPPSIQEKDVGISEYLSDLPGFHAVIKQRFSDFNVHEIDMDGNPAKFTSYELPDQKLFIKEEEIESPLEQETLDNLEKLFDDNASVTTVPIDVTSFSKDKRKSIHQYIKHKYDTNVISNTADEGDKKLIIVSKATSANKDKRRPAHLPKFLHFVLCKANMDTTDALGVIASKLRMKASFLSTAGTKDRRANTSQWVSISNVDAARLNALNKTVRRMRLGNFTYKDYSLSLGSLKGNNFQIALRGVTISDPEIEVALSKLESVGFINYFGLQRFGNCPAAPTHEIGKQLVKEAYDKAIELILMPRPEHRQYDLEQARRIYAETKDVNKALSVLSPKNRSIEALLLRGLKTHGPRAFVNALDCIPRSVRLLYLHAYQGYLWNRVVSLRITKYGLKLLDGDLVLVKPTDVVEPVEHDGEQAIEEKPCPVKHITTAEFNDYTIYDVMMPVPGSSSMYPNEEIKQWFLTILEEGGLTLDSWSSRVKQYSLSGSYRKMVVRPQNMSWSIARYNHAEDDLILSDSDILDGKTLPERLDGEHKAVIISFDLDRSCYATMALREILRRDTSSSSQAELNQNGTKRDAEPMTENEGTPEKQQKER